MAYKELLDKIAGELVGIHVEDLTPAEAGIVQLLKSGNFVTIAEEGEVERTK